MSDSNEVPSLNRRAKIELLTIVMMAAVLACVIALLLMGVVHVHLPGW